MVDEDDEQEQEAGASSYDKQIQLNKFLLIGGIFLTTLVLSIMITGLTVIFMRLSEVAPADGEPSAELLAMEERFLTIEKKLKALSDFRKGELKKVAEFTGQLELLHADCSSERTAPFKELLIDREKDFQQLLKTITSGTTSLSGMAKGSRAWVKQHNKKIDLLVKKSVERQAVLKAQD